MYEYVGWYYGTILSGAAESYRIGYCIELLWVALGASAALGLAACPVVAYTLAVNKWIS
jgi:hypothetical protein